MDLFELSNPPDLRGPQFLLLYLVVLGIAVKAALFKTPPRLTVALRIPRPRSGEGHARAFVERRFTLPLKLR